MSRINARSEAYVRSDSISSRRAWVRLVSPEESNLGGKVAEGGGESIGFEALS